MMDRKILLLLPLLAGLQCTGTETENPAVPLIAFHGGQCKKMSSIGAKGLPAPDGGTLESDTGKTVSFDNGYDGLQCIAWQKLASGAFRFQLGNFHESCGVDWKGSASIAQDGTVVLHPVNAGCRTARCGWCMYDWSFDVRGVAETENALLSISVVDDDGNQCAGARPPYDVTMPTHDAEQGILCRPAFRPAVDEQALARGTTGQLHMPCDPAVQTSCAAELSCGPLASSDDPRCLAPCSTDSDCTLPGILACQEGTCRLAQTW